MRGLLMGCAVVGACVAGFGAAAATATATTETLTLKQGAPADITLAGGTPVVAKCSVPAKTAARVLVTGLKGAVAPAVTVRRGKDEVATQRHEFGPHAVIEWPCMKSGRFDVEFSASSAVTARVKLIAQPFQPLKVGSGLNVPFACEIAPTAWFLLPVVAGKDHTLTVVDAGDTPERNIQFEVRDADGVTVLRTGNGTGLVWEPKAKGTVLCRVTKPLSCYDLVGFTFEVTGAPHAPFPMLDVAPPPDKEFDPDPGTTAEATLKVGGAEPAQAVLYGRAARFIVEVAAGSLKDPVLILRDDDSGKLLGWDDDAGGERNARWEFTGREDQDITITVVSAVSGKKGTATVRVTCKK
jgi:hypothetical protein